MSEQMSAQVPASMSVDAFVRIFDLHLSKVEAALAGIFDEAAKDTKGRSTEEKAAYMQYLMSRADKAEALKAASTEGLGVTAELFQACLMKFGGRAQIVRAMEASHRRQEALQVRYLGAAA